MNMLASEAPIGLVSLSIYDNTGFAFGIQIPTFCIGIPQFMDNLNRLLKPVMEKNGENCALKMIIRTDKFATPGIGWERAISLAVGMPPTLGKEGPSIKLSQLSDFLIQIRNNAKYFDATTEQGAIKKLRMGETPVDYLLSDGDTRISSKKSPTFLRKRVTPLQETVFNVAFSVPATPCKKKEEKQKCSLSMAPPNVFKYLVDLDFQCVAVSNKPAINPSFVVAMSKWSGQSLDAICKEWCSRHYLADELHGFKLQTKVEAFRSMPKENQCLVLKLDQMTGKPNISCIQLDANTMLANVCGLCKLPGLHLMKDCPLFFNKEMRDNQLFIVNRCTGCHQQGCQLGRKAHPIKGFGCMECSTPDHTNDACEALLSKNDNIARQLYMIVALGNLQYHHLEFLQDLIPSALSVYNALEGNSNHH